MIIDRVSIRRSILLLLSIILIICTSVNHISIVAYPVDPVEQESSNSVNRLGKIDHSKINITTGLYNYRDLLKRHKDSHQRHNAIGDLHSSKLGGEKQTVSPHWITPVPQDLQRQYDSLAEANRRTRRRAGRTPADRGSFKPKASCDKRQAPHACRHTTPDPCRGKRKRRGKQRRKNSSRKLPQKKDSSHERRGIIRNLRDNTREQIHSRATCGKQTTLQEQATETSTTEEGVENKIGACTREDHQRKGGDRDQHRHRTGADPHQRRGVRHQIKAN